MHCCGQGSSYDGAIKTLSHEVPFFKHHVQTDKNPARVLCIEKIDTKKQVADIFTKPLDAVTFKTVRALLMGW